MSAYSRFSEFYYLVSCDSTCSIVFCVCTVVHLFNENQSIPSKPTFKEQPAVIVEDSTSVTLCNNGLLPFCNAVSS